jgi:hypothetical protein
MSAPPAISVSQGRSASSHILIMPRGDFSGHVELTASGLPAGVSASFRPAGSGAASVLTLTAESSAAPATAAVTINGTARAVSHSAAMTVSVTRILTGTVPVDLSSAYNVTGIYNDGAKFDSSASLDGGGYALSEQTLGSEQVGAEVVFKLGPAGAPDMVSSKTVDLPKEKFASLRILATAVEGSQESQTFTVNYADGTSSSFTQGLTDWASTPQLPGESTAVEVPYRLVGDGEVDGNPFYAAGLTLPLDAQKQVRSVTLPSSRNVVVLAMTLVPAAN